MRRDVDKPDRGSLLLVPGQSVVPRNRLSVGLRRFALAERERPGRSSARNIRRVRVYKIRYFGSRASYWRCDLTYAGGVRIRLQAAHYAGGGRIEDRSEAYFPFIKQLESQLAQANPDAVFQAASHRLVALDATIGALATTALKLARSMDLDRAANTAADRKSVG